ncbi:MAG TPA: NDP-sugar synthase [Solirubrobacteraceae bacterium]|jgi:mannose-1-phosphate guanylyltransferase/mannose-1-phosphate guanylyltransferase/phosphomannomutase
MRAMVLAAGLGTRLRPITYEVAKPMVPVLDRPVMAHIVDLLERHGIERIVANLHHFPDSIREYFGDRISFRYEEELLGTAGGVRNCADLLGSETFLVISGDALTDIDLDALVATHRSRRALMTLAAKPVADTREYGVVLHDEDGRISGFQEKPEPEDARSDLGNCGIYCLEPEIFEHFPPEPFVDWAHDVFPVLLERSVAFYVHRVDQYWNDIGSLAELRQGTFDALSGELAITVEGERVGDGVIVGTGSGIEAAEAVEGPAWIGRDVTIGAGVRLMGPVVIGDGARIGEGAALRDAIVFPGGEVAAGTILIGAIAGNSDVAASLRPRGS